MYKKPNLCTEVYGKKKEIKALKLPYYKADFTSKMNSQFTESI